MSANPQHSKRVVLIPVKQKINLVFTANWPNIEAYRKVEDETYCDIWHGTYVLLYIKFNFQMTGNYILVIDRYIVGATAKVKLLMVITHTWRCCFAGSCDVCSVVGSSLVKESERPKMYSSPLSGSLKIIIITKQPFSIATLTEISKLRRFVV